jgi:hypothetical protein
MSGLSDEGPEGSASDGAASVGVAAAELSTALFDGLADEALVLPPPLQADNTRISAAALMLITGPLVFFISSP